MHSLRSLRRLRKIGIFLVVWSLVLMVTTSAFAQRTRDVRSSGRDAAMRQCIDKAQSRFPDRTAGGAGRNRVAAYKACMSRAGFAP